MSDDKILVQLEPELHEPSFHEQPGFRVSPSLNEKLLDPARRPAPPPRQEAKRLPEPVYPQRADAREREMSFKEYNRINRSRNVHCWLLPYFRARVRVKEFRPILSYLFTEWKCNLDCLSTCQHTVGYAFSARRVLKWLARQALHGLRGVTGSF